MIPLCANHHSKAEAWTSEQLRSFKAEAADRAAELAGRFEWMRRNVLALIGGVAYYETPNMVVVGTEPVVWYERSEDGHLLLNLRMLTTSGERRTEMRNNDWIIQGTPKDVISPVSGHRLRVTYNNGDDLRLLFWEALTPEAMAKRYRRFRSARWLKEIVFPLLITEVQMTVARAGIQFGPEKTNLGKSLLTGGFVSHCGAGLVLS